ncbi:MAG: archaeal proteasome endopeptidase complex subunit beta [Candidatus Aenigmatarchaeota archaeon]
MQEQQKMETGTTTVGIVYKDGVVLASESKSTLGFLVSSKESKKIYQIDDNIAVTTAGGSGDSQALVRLLKAEINLYKLTRGNVFTVKATASLLSNILQGSRYYPYYSMMIIGGIDKSGPHVFSIDMLGGYERDKYTSTGSGSPMAYGVLEDGFKENMTKEEAIKIAVRAIRSARERDVFSGGKFIVVATIDSQGLKFVEEEKIKELAK